AYAGDIIATMGLKDSVTGDTLCAIDAPIVLESMQFPIPVISVAIEPRTVKDGEKLSDSLVRLAEEDPTFKVRTDQETGQTIISGMGELHLDILVNRLVREFHVNARVGKPQVAFRESVAGAGTGEMKFVKQTSGTSHYAHIALRVEHNDRGKGNEFNNMLDEDALPIHIIAAVEEIIMGAMAGGIRLGYPIVDLKVSLLDGSFSIEDSTEADFRYVALQVFHDACMKATPVLLEPIMAVELVIPKEFVGDVLGNLQQRHGEVTSVDVRNQYQIIEASVALSEMFGYATELRSMTQGRGTFTMQVSHYDEVKRKREEDAFLL
ncbi:elongation factor G, partial [bacterium]|nr:elongation factor G [candidate division CSSED10-310 bacterium]